MATNLHPELEDQIRHHRDADLLRAGLQRLGLTAQFDQFGNLHRLFCLFEVLLPDNPEDGDEYACFISSVISLELGECHPEPAYQKNLLDGKINQFPVLACLLQQPKIDDERILLVKFSLCRCLFYQTLKLNSALSTNLRKMIKTASGPDLSEILSLLPRFLCDDQAFREKFNRAVLTESVKALSSKARNHPWKDHVYSLLSADIARLALVDGGYDNLDNENFKSPLSGSEEAKNSRDSVESVLPDILSITPEPSWCFSSKSLPHTLSKYWEERISGYVSNYWSRLKKDEKRHLEENLKGHLESSDRIEVESALIVSISYVCGMSVGKVLSARVGPSGVFTSDGYFRKTLKYPVSEFRFPKELSHYETPRLYELKLPLPNGVRRQLPELNGGDLWECLHSSYEDIRLGIGALLKKIRGLKYTRLRQERIAAAAVFEANLHWADPLVTYALFSSVDWAPPLLSHYAYVSEQELYEKWSVVQNELWAERPSISEISGENNKVYGYQISTDYIRAFITAIKNELERYRDQGSLADFHNAYTAYTLTLLSFSSGVRPTLDPFQRWSWFDLNLGIIKLMDKAKSGADYRFVPLADSAVEQLASYRLHLQSLASKLSRKSPRNRELVDGIYQLSKGNDQPGLPLFFRLDDGCQYSISISLDYMFSPTPTYAVMPRNLGRKYFCSSLRSRIGANEVRALIGHSDIGIPIWGDLSMGHVQQLQEKKSAIEEAISDIGLTVMQGLVARKNASLDFSVKRKNSCFHRSKDNKGLAIESREQYRRERNKTINLILKDWEYKPPTPDESLNDYVDLLAIKYSVKKQKAIGILERLTRNERRKNYGRNISDSYMPKANALSEYQKVIDIKRRFEGIISEKEFSLKMKDVSDSLALLYVGLVLYRGVADEDLIRVIIEAILSGQIVSGDKGYIVDIKYRSHSSWLFQLDSLTSLLVGRISQQKDIEFNEGKLTEKLMTLLSVIGVSSPKRLLSIQGGYNAITMDGIGVGFLNGKNGGSIGLSRLFIARLYTGKRFVDEVSMLNVEFSNRGHDPVKSPGGFKKNTEKLIKKVDFENNEGASRRTDKKKHLSLVLGELLERGGLTYIESRVISWARSLCVDGTPNKSKLTFGTCRDYFRCLVGLSEAGMKDIDFSLSAPKEIEDKLTALLEKQEKDVKDKTGRLKEFLKYLQKHCPVAPTLDVNNIVPEGNYQRRVDNNCVTYQEYCGCLAYIDHNIACANLADVYKGALILLYRAGLRASEVQGLKCGDIGKVQETGAVTVAVAANQYRELKNNSKRHFVLPECLDPIENSTLCRLVNRAEKNLSLDKHALFLYYENTNTLPSIEPVLYLNRLLKVISGDRSLSCHNLRHGFANRLLCHLEVYKGLRGFPVQIANLLVKNQRLSESADFNREMIDRMKPRDKLNTIAAYMGHKSYRSTLASYDHMGAFYTMPDAGKVACHNVLDSIRYRGLKRISGLSEATLRSQKRRKSGAVHQIQSLTVDINRIVGGAVLQERPKPSGTTSAIRPITAEIIDMALLSNPDDPTGALISLGISGGQYNTIHIAAQTIGRRSGCDPYRLKKRSFRDSPSFNHQENKTLHAFFQSWTGKEKVQTLRAGIESWMDASVSGSNQLRFYDAGSYENFKNCLNSLFGYDVACKPIEEGGNSNDFSSNAPRLFLVDGRRDQRDRLLITKKLVARILYLIAVQLYVEPFDTANK